MNTTQTTTETAARLRRAITRLHRRLRATSLSGVTPTQASILATLGQLGHPTLGDLAVAEQIQPPSVTRLVRDMERVNGNPCLCSGCLRIRWRISFALISFIAQF